MATVIADPVMAVDVSEVLRAATGDDLPPRCRAAAAELGLPWSRLTDDQVLTLRLRASGLTPAQVAAVRGRSVAAMWIQLGRIRVVIGARDDVHLTGLAIVDGVAAGPRLGRGYRRDR